MMSGAGRMLAGAGIGGLYGGLTSDSNTGSGVFRDALGGATMGLGIGALTTKTALEAGWGVTKRLGRRGIGLAKRTPGVAWRGGKMALKTAKFVNNHPLIAGGLGLGVMGISSATAGGYSTPGLSNQQLSESASLAGTSTGSYSRTVNQSLVQSTHNLVQGLHQGRHK